LFGNYRCQYGQYPFTSSSRRTLPHIYIQVCRDDGTSLDVILHRVLSPLELDPWRCERVPIYPEGWASFIWPSTHSFVLCPCDRADSCVCSQILSFFSIIPPLAATFKMCYSRRYAFLSFMRAFPSTCCDGIRFIFTSQPNPWTATPLPSTVDTTSMVILLPSPC
jgi:hypothetical protein